MCMNRPPGNSGNQGIPPEAVQAMMQQGQGATPAALTQMASNVLDKKPAPAAKKTSKGK